MSQYETFRGTPTRRRRSRTMTTGIVVTAVIVVIIVAVFGYIQAYKSTERNVSFTVNSKDRVCDSSSNNQQTCRYLVFTDEGTYQVTDSILIGRFSSSDVYGRIRQDHHYDARVIGWRIPVLSRYPNIVSIQEQPR